MPEPIYLPHVQMVFQEAKGTQVLRVFIETCELGDYFGTLIDEEDYVIAGERAGTRAECFAALALRAWDATTPINSPVRRSFQPPKLSHI